MACDVNDGVLLSSLWQHLACAHLLNQFMNRIETVLLSLAMVEELLPIQCGPSCGSMFPICPVTVAIRIPSSASTPQVGFMCTKASPIQEERFKSQGRRRSLEVLCSGVPLGSLAPFWDGCRLWEINSRVWKSKRIEEISVDFHTFHQCLRQSLIAKWFKSWCLMLFLWVYLSFWIWLDLTQDCG